MPKIIDQAAHAAQKTAQPKLASAPKKPLNKKNVCLGISIPYNTALLFDAVCRTEGRTRSDLGKQVLKDWLDAHGYTQDWLDNLEPVEERELY